MCYKNKDRRPADCESAAGADWLKFIVGVFILAGVIVFFSSGYTPPGVFGEVLRHNQEHKIDASPFFYGDVENMTEYEEGVRQMREKAKEKSEL